MEKIKPVYHQFYKFGGLTEDTAETIVLRHPSYIKFTVVGLSCVGSRTGLNSVIINNFFELQPYIDTLTGIASFPYELELPMQQNEADFTQWTLKIPAGVIVNVVTKYYQN